MFDAIAKQIRAVDHNIADMYADAEAHRVSSSTAGVFRSDSALHGNGAPDRIDRTGEIGDHAVAGGVEDAASMSCDGR